MPGARRSEISGTVSGRLKARLQAPPVEGKANKALVALLAGALGLRANRLSIVAGERSREKTVLIRGISLTDVAERLKSL